jgi:hypothetical protein
MTSPEVPRHPRARGLLLGGLLTGVLLASGSFALWTALAGPEPLRTESGEQFHAQQVTDVDISLGSSSVALVEGKPGAVRVQRQLTWSRAKPLVEERIVGRTLRISARCPNVFLSRPGQCRVDLAVEVPPGVAVRAHVGSGSIRADGLTGALQLQTYDGGITLAGTRGPLSLRSGSGHVIGTDLAGLEADVRAMWADVSLRFAVVPDHVHAETGTGDVTVAVPVAGTGAEGYQIRGGTRNTGRRDIDVLQETTGRHTIAALTEKGDVSVRYTTVR